MDTNQHEFLTEARGDSREKFMMTLREQPGAAVTALRFVVGEKRLRPVEIPVFECDSSQKVVAHKVSLTDKVTVWHVRGFGRTAMAAKQMAGLTNLDFFMPEHMGSNARFGVENQVAA